MNLPGHVSIDVQERPGNVCPSCGAAGATSFYRVGQLPVHSVLLMRSREQAQGVARRDLDLCRCAGCGFVFNAAFDPDVHNYSPEYEETQHCSPTFDGFARDLTQRLFDEYELADKVVLEIGCGKGEFLYLLARLGVKRAIGIDPGYQELRLPELEQGQLEFIRDFYSEKYEHLAADFVCCRHTLEHIAPVQDFMRSVQRTTRGRPETVVLFEVPDNGRVLRSGAFWDIYYEHCSYFDAGSLDNLFRRSGFAVERVWLEFNDQYLLIAARPGGDSDASPKAAVEQEPVVEIAARLRASVSHWRDVVEESRRRDERIALWGGGSKAVAFLTTLGVDGEVAVVDINPRKWGMFLPGTGHETSSPDGLREYRPDLVIVMNPAYVAEIQEELKQRGLAPRVVSLD